MNRLTLLVISVVCSCIYGCGINNESNKSDYITECQDMLLGEWGLAEYDSVESMKLNDTICFKTEGSYYRTLNESGEWSYKYINPDSLIIYNKDFGEQRFRIIKLSNDSLILQLKENVIYGDTTYNGTFDDIEKYIRLN